ncbi:JNK-interacting protein 3 isoform X2 [Coccinella septempunctata]|uniref:JNK-interacting protein 3 isoform X2 n=1 Tax=Coccinella septempunctata TaxID=41139 RepID=UPI001D067D7F|nr:JNK-interacting protein 3 isoform X2 [Coccinella septempunctata]
MELGDTGCVGPETVYVTQEDSPLVMSEKVQSLAGSIYQEFEKMIARYDEDVVKSLMPLLVNVLECLDAAYQQNQEHDVELELLREDNEQLVTQYEREKSARKAAEQKLLEFEDAAEGERKDLTTRLESLESIVRMLELKHKNSLEHAGRLEEREGDLKKEFSKLHERYTELFKTHVDYMERTKILLSGQQLANEKAEINRLNSNRLNIVGRSSGPMSFGFASLENAEIVDSVPSSPISSTQSSPSLHSEAEVPPKDTIQVDEPSSNQLSPEAKSTVTSPTSPECPPPPINNVPSRIHTKKEHRSGNTLYEELTFQDADAEEDSEITGGWVHPGDYASSGMGKEVENLIMENNELLATKNALNVVKDDLIAKVDELTGEQEMLREEILSLKISRTKLKERVSELEDELKKVREANEARIEAGEDNSDVPMAQRKRFTRVEMARVLMERNQYKERFMELQDALRWTEMIRAQKGEAYDKKQSPGIWRFFNKLFNGSDRPTRANLRYQTTSTEASPSIRALPRAGQDSIETEMGSISDKLMMKRVIDKRDQYRNLKAHVRKEDGRMHAYGWSLPGKTTPATKGSVTGVPVPIPVYCRPLTESSPEMNVWCAAGVTSMEGYLNNSNDLDKEELDSAREASDESYEEQLKRDEQKVPLSSQVWICSFTHTASIVTIIDANNPAEILDSFGVCTSRILCIASVPSSSPTDIVSDTPLTCSNLSSPIKEVSKTEPDDFVSIPTIVTEGAKQIDKDAELQEEKKYLGKIYYIENEPSISRRRNSTVSEEPMNTGEQTETEESKPVEENAEAEPVVESEPEPQQDVVSSKSTTMWIGTENGSLYVHSAVAQCRRCLHSVRLRDTIMSIVHIKGQVVVALACGMMAVFKRNKEGEWDLSNYYLVQVGLPQQPIRCLQVVDETVWCGYRNKIHVLQPNGLKIIHSIEAHPRTESLVRHMACLGVGVWVSIRLDSTLRLYHAETYQHLQDVDIEPYVSKMLGTGKLGFTFVRITCLLVSSYRLWIGTSNGVIISVPLSGEYPNEKIVHSTDLPNASGEWECVPPVPTTGFVPYCSLSHAQLSFHGHKTNVKFFVAVPGNVGSSPSSNPSSPSGSPVSTKNTNAMLVMSGGEGYIDFRIGDEDSDVSTKNEVLSQEENSSLMSHLIVWQVSTSKL